MNRERFQRRIEQLLDEADEAVASSDWARVKDRAENVLRLDPTMQTLAPSLQLRTIIAIQCNGTASR